LIIAFQILSLIIIVISFVGVIVEKEDKKLQENMTFLCAIALGLFFASVVWL